MGYFVLLFTIIVYLIRPAEWIPVLYFNWNMLLNALGMLVILTISLNQNRKFNYDRTTLFLIWFMVAMILSNIVNGQIYTISGYFFQILSTLIVFSLTQNVIRKPKQIDGFILIIILIILFICYQCYLQSTVGVNWGGLEPLSRGVGGINPDTGKSMEREYQVIWFGILQDPNDLGMLLVAFAPYIINRVFYQPLPFFNKVFWFLAILVICYTIILTNSRGSMLALIGSLGLFYIIKNRSLGGLILAIILALALITIAPSRMGELGSGDYSAMGRIYAWILAIELLASRPLFGIGAMHFLDYHGLTTHNSYVLAAVETGILGFLGYLSVFTLAVFTSIKVAYSLEDIKRKVELISLVSGMLGIMISTFFISRTYVLLPFLYIAILMTYMHVYTPTLLQKHIGHLSIKKLLFICVSFIILLYIFNRLATTILL